MFEHFYIDTNKLRINFVVTFKISLSWHVEISCGQILLGDLIRQVALNSYLEHYIVLLTNTLSSNPKYWKLLH